MIEHYRFSVIVYVRGPLIVLLRSRKMTTGILSFGSHHMTTVGITMERKIVQITEAGMECRVSF